MIPIQYTNHNQTTHLHEQNGVVYMTFRQLDRMGVPHAFSTRLGGVSQGYLSTMNLSFHRGDDPDGWQRLLDMTSTVWYFPIRYTKHIFIR